MIHYATNKKNAICQLSQVKETSALFNSGIFETVILNSTEQAKEHMTVEKLKLGQTIHKKFKDNMCILAE